MQKKNKPDNQKIIILTNRCNQDCVFCSGTERRVTVKAEIKKEILTARRAVIFEGGEPTLSVNLINLIKFAKNNNVPEIILVTNGVMLSSKNLTEKLIDSGVTLFNISFHSHLLSLYNKITKSNYYHLATRGIKNLINCGASKKTRLTFVVSKINYKTMPAYIRWVIKNFPDIFYIALNYIKVLGVVKKNPYKYVPRFSAVKPYLLRSLEIARKNKVKVLVDGFPLCLMKEYPKYRYREDTYEFMVSGNLSFAQEKVRVQKCKTCSLNSVCNGIRDDYFKLYKNKELRPQ
ncbi:MAG: radical SAM protein [Candidatus Pacebacteria bacterium]|nr:radical SAM protein [Candidatus Paceibacterota bacterium]